MFHVKNNKQVHDIIEVKLHLQLIRKNALKTRIFFSIDTDEYIHSQSSDRELIEFGTSSIMHSRRQYLQGYDQQVRLHPRVKSLV